MSRWGRGGIRAGCGALLAGALIAGVPGILDSTAYAGTSPTAPATTAPATAASASQAAESHATKVAIKVGPTALDFGVRRAGTISFTAKSTVKNVSKSSVTIENINFSSGNAADFVVGTTCFPAGKPATLDPGQTCLIQAKFVPRRAGLRTVKVRVVNDASTKPTTVTLQGVGTMGYYQSGAAGGVASFGDAVFRGQRRRFPLAAPIIAMNATRGGSGYWLLGSDGGIFSFGNAKFFGSTGAMHLNRPVVGMGSVPDGSGYWLVASDGGIFSFGSAKFYGSTGGMRLNQPIVGMTVTRTGKGYYLVAADGGIFSFGDAKFYGSTAGIGISQPAAAVAITATGHGYYMLLRNGSVYTFGDAVPLGSAAGLGRGGSFVGIALTSNGRGLWLSNSVGQIFQFGDAPYYGDLYLNGVQNATGVVATAPLLPPPRFGPTVGVIKAASTGMLDARLDQEANARI
jgi:hypothetical protein